MLNRPTSQTFIKGLKYNNTNTCKFTENPEQQNRSGLCMDRVLVIRNCGAASVGSITRRFGFINWVDNVNWAPWRDSKADGGFEHYPSSVRINKTKLPCDKALAAKFYIAIYFLNNHPTFQLSSCHLPNNRIYDRLPNEFMFCVSIPRRSAYKYQTKYNCSNIIPGFILNKLRDDINSLVKCTLQALRKNEKQSLSTVLYK